MLHTICGAPLYAAPELASKNYGGEPADVWSMGVILFNMVTGGHPFTLPHGADLRKYFAAVNLQTLHIPEDVAPEIARILRHLLLFQPSQRWTVDQLLSDKWFESEHVMYDCKIKTNMQSTPEAVAHYKELAQGAVLRVMYEVEDKLHVWEAKPHPD
eukprot:Colp12_sorted_trinity150504_noHs@35851